MDTAILELSTGGVAPLQEISINDAQTRLMSKMTKRNMEDIPQKEYDGAHAQSSR